MREDEIPERVLLFKPEGRGKGLSYDGSISKQPSEAINYKMRNFELVFYI